MKTTATGRQAEAAVANYLTCQGFDVITRNWRNRRCEIDIVAQKHKTVYFIEVKYRSNLSQGGGFEYIGPHKLQQLRFAAEYWAAVNKWRGDCRLLAAEVTGPDYGVIELLEID
ncbi:MAG TPA: YraN family protein [Candidatus Saccharimonadales bacterium]|nr:YraN family protein [Candidatus Saccharimonadales bacterium]